MPEEEEEVHLVVMRGRKNGCRHSETEGGGFDEEQWEQSGMTDGRGGAEEEEEVWPPPRGRGLKINDSQNA